MSNSNENNFWKGMFLGSIVGGALGVLLASKTGEEIRGLLQERGLELQEDIRKYKTELQQARTAEQLAEEPEIEVMEDEEVNNQPLEDNKK